MKQIDRRALAALLAGASMSALARPALGSTLHGSHASMVHQHAIAVKLDYSFVRTPAQVKALVADSALERVAPNSDLQLSGVSYPCARPAVHDFVDWLAAAYHSATGSRLVVTSLTRPTSLQPANASPLSVHPAGMAVDLRIPASSRALDWLEHTLLSLEKAGVLDVTREHHPPHLHVAVFPEQYARYAAAHAPVAAPTIATAPDPIPLHVPTASTAAGSADGGVASAALAGALLGLLLASAFAAATFRGALRAS
jgi:hypothetical protein